MFANVSRWAILIAFVLFVVVLLSMLGIRIVKPGTVGVPVFFGTVGNEVLQPGFHIVKPLTSVAKFSTRTEEYTMSIATDEGQRRGNDSIEILTADGLKIALDWTIWYRLDPDKAIDLYVNVGPDFEEKIIRPAIRTAVREPGSQYQAMDIFSTKREEYVNSVTTKLNETISKFGFIVDGANLRNVLLPQSVQSSIEAKLSADQDQQKMEYVIMKEQKEADRRQIEAAGIAKANAIIANSLTTEYLEWYYIEAFKGLANAPNTTFIFGQLPMSDQGLIPFLNKKP